MACAAGHGDDLLAVSVGQASSGMPRPSLARSRSPVNIASAWSIWSQTVAKSVPTGPKSLSRPGS